MMIVCGAPVAGICCIGCCWPIGVAGIVAAAVGVAAVIAAASGDGIACIVVIVVAGAALGAGGTVEGIMPLVLAILFAGMAEVWV